MCILKANLYQKFRDKIGYALYELEVDCEDKEVELNLDEVRSIMDDEFDRTFPNYGTS